jgi:DNA-binding CsgD family transcriptional regulator
MNGIPAEVHIGKTVREVIGSVASSVELMLRSVLMTGESILNAEIRGNLPTRDGEGHWIEHYFPVRDAANKVTQVGVVVVEITGLRRLENSILSLIGNVGRTKRRLPKLGTAYGLEKQSIDLRGGSIESVENSLREGLKNSLVLERLAETPDTGEVVGRQPVPLRYAPSASGEEPYRPKRSSTPASEVARLSPREIQIVRLLGQGNSNKEISTALKISVKTVEAYRAKIMLKLQIHSLTDLVLYAVRSGLVRP